MKFLVYQRSEQGGRASNEDRVGYVYTQEAAIFILADGMGGHAYGEIAAQIALECVSDLFERQALPTLADPREFLSNAFMYAHEKVFQYAQERGMRDGPRTTLTVLVIQNGQATWAHCGDSRLYWIRAEQLLKRTIDHSYAEQRSVGAMAGTRAQQLARIRNRNILFTCIGSPFAPIYDVSEVMTIEPSDKFLLASDGLWNAMPEPEMIRTLAFHSVTHGVPELINWALKNSGSSGDNVTAIGVEWKGS
ncbi:MAG: serine/threonine-protein phosphatase [Cytophagales bacterium]|nr:serine/threonine-protein phosphatase [Cytophagales bacterium]